MTESPSEVPTRNEVALHWRRLIDGQESREEAHLWAAQWVEAEEGDVADPMVGNALLRLHGFDMTRNPMNASLMRHGEQGEFVHSRESIAEAFQKWCAECSQYDADPEGFRAGRRAAVREFLRREKGR
ncbi:hypothetical protein HUT19_12370 [Streptomyces sp. NA02950]|uniref:hypothetical protein n=1 Tax=Streptomyces sp. NA02950 TaxID=2742137 RepID=UPI0015908403|nr:hypothetical protein [Streptomyces sp. NA02950]QKV92448.1 hypothetical protein HUT19_12370 [Streptomyces sp. NA02950]